MSSGTVLLLTDLDIVLSAFGKETLAMALLWSLPFSKYMDAEIPSRAHS